jgi:serine/threonine protein kinase/Tol biopolymer transport system component
MTADQWQRVEALYHAALELPVGERKDFLVRASSGDEVVRRKVEALLKSHDEGGGFLDKHALEVAARTTAMRAGVRGGSLLGATISHYKTLSLCGVGGMGEVYLAEDERLDRKVALKILPHEVGRDEERMLRFTREAKAASALNHPNVATIYDVGESDGVHFIAMEYVDGQTLREKIDGGPIGPALLIEIGRQVADALDAAHDKGITHRDVKPANLMLTSRGQVKVLDFGLAKITRSQEQQESAASKTSGTVPGIIMGTVDYMSPEQVLGRNVDHRTDIFSLGVVLYEMATGRLPFPGSTTGERLSQILHSDPDPILRWNPNAPPELELLVRKCLEKDPANRYQSAAELLVDLANLQRLSRPLQTVATRRSRLLVLLCIVLIGGLTVWWMAWRDMPAQPQQQVSRISRFPGAHREASFSPDGTRIAFISDVDGVPQVWVKTLAGGDPVQVTRGAQAAGHPRWAPKGDHILYELLSPPNTPQGYPTGDLWLVSPESGDSRKLITDGINPNVSWNGERLVFERGAELWIAKADGTEQRRIENLSPIDFRVAQRRPALSPDGTLIAFFQNEPGVPWGDIWIIPATGGVARRLTWDSSRWGGLTWTPDSRYIVFSSERGGSMTLWKVPVAAGKPEPVLFSAGEDTDPEVSRDGRNLIYTNTRTTRTVVITDPATGKSDEIYSSPTRKTAAFFSPRADRIAFTEVTETGPQLFTMRTDGTNRTQITREAGTQSAISHWSRDGATLYYYQLSPTPSFRKIPAQGGQSVEIGPGWTWGTHHAAKVDPEEKRIIYSRLDRNTAVQTTIRDVQTGNETPFTRALLHPHWSSDGRFVAGRDSFGNITICPADGGQCRSLAMNGWAPRWLFGDSRIYFDREGAMRKLLEVWSVSRDGRDERRVADLVDFAEFVDYSFTGQILWVRHRSTSSELWLSSATGH